MRLIIIMHNTPESYIYLLNDLDKLTFDKYLMANNKWLGSDENEVLDELNDKLTNAIVITNPTDERIKNVDGIITIGLAL